MQMQMHDYYQFEMHVTDSYDRQNPLNETTVMIKTNVIKIQYNPLTVYRFVCACVRLLFQAKDFERQHCVVYIHISQ